MSNEEILKEIEKRIKENKETEAKIKKEIEVKYNNRLREIYRESEEMEFMKKLLTTEFNDSSIAHFTDCGIKKLKHFKIQIRFNDRKSIIDDILDEKNNDE